MTGIKESPRSASEAEQGAVEATPCNKEFTAESGAEQALGFIECHTAGWLPEWYVQVIAIELDGAIKTKAVHPNQIDSLGPWIKQHRGGANLYFAVNPLWHDPGKKCSREDMAALAYVHADLDPPKVKLTPKQLVAEKQQLQAAAEALTVPPGTMIDTGNGIATYWELEQPVLVNPDDRRNHADALGDTNRRLCQALGADKGATDISRVMRLPFTTNYPVGTKLELERPVSPTRLLYQNEAVHNLADFDFLPPVAFKAEAVDLGDVDLSGIDELSLAIRYATHQQYDPDLKLLLEGKAPAWSRDREGSGLDHAYALTLFRLGYSRAENFFLLSNYEHGKKSRARDEKYLKATVDKFYAPKAVAVSDPDSPRARDEYYIASFAERRKNRKANRWQVKGRFRMGTINIVFGSSGTYKSTTIAGLAVALQRLPRWHDSSIENSGGGVLIIAAEDDEGVVDMIEAACLEYGIDQDSVAVYITHGGYDLSNPEVIQGIKGTIATMPVPLSAIIIDTLNRNCGELDENSASDMRNFLNKLDELRGDASVYVIHHNGHTEKERERGAYAIRCNADSSVLCTFDEDSQLFTMEWKKLRSAPLPKPLTLKPKTYVIRQEADSTGVLEDVTAVCMVMSGEAHRNARVEAFYAKYPELGAGERRKYLKVLMSRLLNKPGETQKALATLCGHSQSTIRDTLIALRERRFVTGEKEPLKLTKAGMEVLNELELDVAVAFKEQGVDVQLLAKEKTLEAVLEAKSALLQ